MACDHIFLRWFKMAFLHGVFENVSSRNIEQVKKSTFIPRKWDWVDPYKDAMANKILLNLGLISPKELAKSRSGKDIEETYQEIAYCKDMREEFNIALPDDIPIDNKLLEDEDEDDKKDKKKEDKRAGAIALKGGKSLDIKN